MSIRWTNRDYIEQACPVCAAVGAIAFMEVDHAGRAICFQRCTKCHSVYPSPFVDDASDGVGGYKIGRSADDMSLKHYVEVGAGVDSLIQPLLTVVDRPRGRLLDVGCGFGFLVAVWQSEAGLDCAHGIELASYGHWGRELLSIDISHTLLGSNPAVDGRTFDYVWAGEVIEHVDDPLAFLTQIKSRLAAGGMLLLTTPDAACVSPETSAADLMAALYLGAHRFLLSAEKFESLLRSVGFANVAVKRRGATLVAWASDKPLPFLRDVEVRSAAITARYLEALTDNANPWLRGGALYRLFKFSINQADFYAADRYCDRLLDVVTDQIGPEKGWRVFINNIETKGLARADLIRAMPCYLGPFMFYRAMLLLNHYQNFGDAFRNFDLAGEICRYWVETSLEIAQEPASLLTAIHFHRELCLRRLSLEGRELLAFSQINDPNGFSTFRKRYQDELHWPA